MQLTIMCWTSCPLWDIYVFIFWLSRNYSQMNIIVHMPFVLLWLSFKKKDRIVPFKCLQSIKEGKIWIGKFRAVWDRDWRDLGDLSCEFTEMRCHSDYSNSQDMNKLYWAHGICVTVNRFNIVTFMFFILRTLNESELIGKRISSGGHHC